MKYNRIDGSIGESLAVDYLQGKGYVILQTNYFCPMGEIDIVAKQGDTYVFVEVKKRSSLRFGLPQEAITPYKIRHIKLSAMHYLKKHRLLDNTPVRFDCIAILSTDYQDVEINHIENIF